MQPSHSVNAADHGFLPGNSGTANAASLQALVDCGGTIVIDKPGIYDLSDTIVLSDDTALCFGAGVYVRRALSEDGAQRQGYVFVNRGAYSRAWNHDISITGLRLITSGMDPAGSAGARLVTGLNAHLAFFYMRNLIIRDFELMDLGPHGFGIQICTFENALLENLHIEGMKDAVHFGKGSKFVVRHGIFRTFDDPIALNANDYSTSNPQMGWIEDGLIEDCYDLDQPETTGFFCRILAGSWLDWRAGMEVQHSDSVISEGRLYRVVMQPDGAHYISRTRPTHADGAMVLDGINWVMVQDDDPIYNCGCRNIHFRDIFLEKHRPVAFAIHFDHDNWSRSYYPGSEPPVQRDLIFENIHFGSEIPTLVIANTPVNVIKIVNSSIENSRIQLKCLPEVPYGKTHVLLSGNTLRGRGAQPLLECRSGRTATLNVTGSIVESDDLQPSVIGAVQITSSDIPLSIGTTD